MDAALLESNHRLIGCPFLLSVISFAAHCEVVAVEADAQSRAQYAGVLTKTMATITTLYVVLSVFAFACFGDATSANIMLNLGNNIYVNLVRVTVSCTLLVNIAMVGRHACMATGPPQRLAHAPAEHCACTYVAMGCSFDLDSVTCDRHCYPHRRRWI